MIFTSLGFLLFFPAVFTLTFLLPSGWRPAALFAASLAFYLSFGNSCLPLFAGTAAICHGCALLLSSMAGRPARKRVLCLGLGLNIALLLVFKYAGFATRSVNGVMGLSGTSFSLPELDLVLPVGISFYTFQGMGYLIDVYRGMAPERRFDRTALFLGYFPLLLSGPIERAGHLLPQLAGRIAFNPALATSGLRLILWGLFKKLVVADNLAPFVDRVYAAPASHGGPELAAATLAYGYQLFCDFSGYCDIAVGCSRLLGIELTQNFRQPYHALSVRDFWRRWHISLSTWFRDYLYIPMGGGRGSGWQVSRNLALVFLVCGLWHGANWTFVVWGGLHGLYLASERLFGSSPRAAEEPRDPGAIRILVRWAFTYAIVHFAWIFFRATSLGQAMEVVSGLGSGWGTFLASCHPARLLEGQNLLMAVRAVFLESPLPAIALCETVMFLEASGRLPALLGRMARTGRFAAYSALCWWIVAFGNFGQKSFIYFAF